MRQGNSFHDGCAIESRGQFYTVACSVHFLSNSFSLIGGSDHYWDIAHRLRGDVSQRGVLLYREIMSTKQAGALEEQRLLFGGLQLEDGFSPSGRCRPTFTGLPLGSPEIRPWRR